MVSALPELLPMQPYLREMVWGGRRLESLYAKPLPPGAAIGEAFELSAYAGRESQVSAGPLRGRTLSSLVREFGSELVGRGVWQRYGTRFPLLVKLLDAQQDLSVQVHPDDAYARRHGLGEAGKTETWFVLHSHGGRVAYGLQPNTTRQILARALSRNRMDEVIRFYQVESGDVLFIPAGTVHALGSGVVLYELQQSSDVTFRIHDYGRRGLDGRPRQLHVRQALEVIDFGARLDAPTPWWKLAHAQPDRAVLVDCEHFQLGLFRLAGSPLRHTPGESFVAVTVVEGTARFSAAGSNAAQYSLEAGGTLLIPARREFTAEALGAGDCVYLVAGPGHD
jgi:mannose-6-phosphate isomerase